MSAEVENPPQQSAVSLLRGALLDLEHLVEQQFRLTRLEIEEELRQGSAAAALFLLGVTVVFLAAFVVCLSLAHLMHWMTSPTGSDPAWLPLWACYAIVAAVLAVLGGVLMHVGRSRFRSVEMCQNPVTEILQEPVQ